jgi:rhodanese-related sulfurtransferase
MKSRNLKSNTTELAILVFFIAGVFSIIMYLISQRDPDYPIDSDKFIEFIEVNKPIIVDLRESNEITQYPLNYQPLIHYPFLELQKDISKLNLEISKTYLFVCTDGNRARLINSNFSAKGIITYYLKDGLWGVPQKQLEQLKEMTD